MSTKLRRRLKIVGSWTAKLLAVLTCMVGTIWAVTTCMECPDDTRKLIETRGLRLLGAATLIVVGLAFHCAFAVLEE